MRQTADPTDPANTCWGCGPASPGGLQLRFERHGERGVRAAFTAPAEQCGRPDVVHGGVQAALLDEVMGAAVTVVVPYTEPCVTAELRLRFRRPVPIAELIHVEGEVVEVTGPNIAVEGRIVGSGGEVLTEATARWKVLGSSA